MPIAQLLDVIDLKKSSGDAANSSVDRILKAVRTHLGMDVAFAANVTSTQTVIRHADTAARAPFKAGDSFPVDDGYCKRILDGRIPALIHDAAAVPEVAGLACTREMPIGAHLSVPLRLSDGSVYGTFCCFSFQPDHSLTQRDTDMMHAFADLAAAQIEERIRADENTAEIRARIARIVEQDDVTMVYQPIYRLAGCRVVGVEALARFPDAASRPPDTWFAEAASVGLGTDLELAATRAALRGMPYLPGDMSVAINVSPETILSGRLEEALHGVPAGRIVLEVTEHAIVADYVGLLQALKPLRKHARIAVDDAGAGYSGLRHILDIRPDIIKLDTSLTRGIDADPARFALATALLTFADQLGSEIVAEGIETAAELEALRSLGVGCGQGYFLSRPMPIAAAAQFLIARQSCDDQFSERSDPDEALPRRACVTGRGSRTKSRAL